MRERFFKERYISEFVGLRSNNSKRKTFLHYLNIFLKKIELLKNPLEKLLSLSEQRIADH